MRSPGGVGVAEHSRQRVLRVEKPKDQCGWDEERKGGRRVRDWARRQTWVTGTSVSVSVTYGCMTLPQNLAALKLQQRVMSPGF